MVRSDQSLECVLILNGWFLAKNDHSNNGLDVQCKIVQNEFRDYNFQIHLNYAFEKKLWSTKAKQIFAVYAGVNINRQFKFGQYMEYVNSTNECMAG
jgi:hypothetical protein